MENHLTPDQIIDALGGTSEVARLCAVSDPSVSQWRKAGIPAARLMFIKVVRPDIFTIRSTKATPPTTTESQP